MPARELVLLLQRPPDNRRSCVSDSTMGSAGDPVSRLICGSKITDLDGGGGRPRGWDEVVESVPPAVFFFSPLVLRALSGSVVGALRTSVGLLVFPPPGLRCYVVDLKVCKRVKSV